MCPHGAIHREIVLLRGNLYILTALRCGANLPICDDCFERWLVGLGQ